MREILELHDDMELPELRRTETEFSSRKSIVADSPLGFQVLEIGAHIASEFRIENAVGEAAPDMIDVDDPIPGR